VLDRFILSAPRPVSERRCRPEKADHRPAQGAREMKRPGIAPYDQMCSLKQGNQLEKRELQVNRGCGAPGRHQGSIQGFFARPSGNYHTQIQLGLNSLRQIPIARRAPSFCRPSAAGIDNDKLLKIQLTLELIDVAHLRVRNFQVDFL
jgi:hypothetical protein